MSDNGESSAMDNHNLLEQSDPGNYPSGDEATNLRESVVQTLDLERRVLNMRVSYKPNAPRTLESTATDKIEVFMQQWMNYIKYFGEYNHGILLSSYIAPKCLLRLRDHSRHIFAPFQDTFGNERFAEHLRTDAINEHNERIEKYFQKILREEEDERLDLKRENLTTFEWEVEGEMCLRRAVREHVGKAKSFYELTSDETCKRDVLIRCMETLPEQLMMRPSDVKNGKIKTFDDVEKLIEERKFVLRGKTTSDYVASGGSTVQKTRTRSRKAIISANVVTYEEVSEDDVKEFDSQEREAERIGICMACTSSAHHRDMCTDKENREGRQKRFFGKCFNCHNPGHGYRECPQPLTEKLQARKDYLEKKYSKKNGSNSYSNNKGKVSFNEKANKIVESNSSNTQVSSSSSSSNNDVIDAGKAVFEEGNHPRDKVEVLDKDNIWHEVDGCADTGCDTSTGSVQKHAHLCQRVWEFIGRETVVRTASNDTFKVTKQGIMTLRVNGVKVKEDVLVMLVDAPEWPKLLIGRNAMNRFHITAKGN